jgi:hypothetical protein
MVVQRNIEEDGASFGWFKNQKKTKSNIVNHEVHNFLVMGV